MFLYLVVYVLGAGWQTNLQNSTMPPTASFKAPILSRRIRPARWGPLSRCDNFVVRPSPSPFTCWYTGRHPTSRWHREARLASAVRLDVRWGTKCVWRKVSLIDWRPPPPWTRRSQVEAGPFTSFTPCPPNICLFVGLFCFLICFVFFWFLSRARRCNKK